MATRNIVPRGNKEGGIGTSAKAWKDGYFHQLYIMDGTGNYLKVPSMTEAERNSVPLINGMVIRNADTGLIERYEEGVWIGFGPELGETASTSYRGDRGKAAYDHSLEEGNAHSLTKADIGLGNVTNDAQIPLTQKGVANGVTPLDNTGKVPITHLPSYVDDMYEYANFAALPATGVDGKIYITLDTNQTFRWSGTQYTQISSNLTLGNTSATAYRGDYGESAYTHSLADHAPADAEKNVQADWTQADDTSDSFIKNKPTLGGAALLDVGTLTGTVCAGDDARLSDTRDPKSHTHTKSEITDFGTYCRWRGASETEPESPLAGDIWIDTSSTPVTKVYSGTAWV